MELLLPTHNDALLVLLKVVGDACNIDCDYCYEKRKFDSKSHVLSPETVERFLALAGPRPLHIVLHGGEPLLIGMERLGRMLRTITRRAGPTRLSLQTNGTLLSDAWLDLFEDHCPQLDIAVSLDGDPHANRHRVDFRGRPTFEAGSAALMLLSQRGWRAGAIAVVNRASLGRAREILGTLAAYDAVCVIRFTPCFDYDVVSRSRKPTRLDALTRMNSGSGVPAWGITPTEYREFLLDVWAVWREAYFENFLVQPHTDVIRNIAGHECDFVHLSQRKDPFIYTLYPNGDLHSSDELRADQSYLGNVWQTDLREPLPSLHGGMPLHAVLGRLLAHCDACSVKGQCRGGALPVRVRYEGTSHAAEYCDNQRQFIRALELECDRAGIAASDSARPSISP